MEMPEPPPQEPVPSSDLLRISAGGAVAALLTGFLFGYLKVGSSGMKYFMTGSYGGDGAIAGLIAAVVAFFLCTRIAERVVETLDRRLDTAQYALLAIGAGIGLVFGIFMTVIINMVGARMSRGS
jgi:hypothetical protein